MFNEKLPSLRYVGSRIYLHNPPGEGNALTVAPNAPHALKTKERESEEEEPQMNQWSCLLAFLIAIPLLAITAEWVRFIMPCLNGCHWLIHPPDYVSSL